MKGAAGKIMNYDKRKWTVHRIIDKMSVVKKILYLSQHIIRQTVKSCNLTADVRII